MTELNIKLIENIITWQGEGPDIGKRMNLLRFKYCNRACSWCDTSVKMRVTSEAEYKLSDIQKNIGENKVGLLITGGEPTYEQHFSDCVKLLNNLDYSIANVETNGYKLEELTDKINPSKNIHYIYSPKIFNEKDLKEAFEITEYFLFRENVFVKIVYENNIHLNSYLEWLATKSQFSFDNRVYLMPQGITREELLKNSPAVFDACEKYKFNFSSRDHIIYGFI